MTEEEAEEIKRKYRLQKESKDFFCNDNVSRQAPGKRDVKSIRNDVTGKREKIPIRYMMMNIVDAFCEFQNQHPSLKISRAYFFKFRPKFVLPAKQTPFNTTPQVSFGTNLQFQICEDLGFSYIEWNTFAALHGKGAVDGVGAAVKNAIWTKVRSENINLHSARDYYYAALKYCQKTNIFFVEKKEITANSSILNLRFRKCLKIECIDEETSNSKKHRIKVVTFDSDQQKMCDSLRCDKKYINTTRDDRVLKSANASKKMRK
ncbi:unnamed protein product [Brassicogethes aeneus]|uniref:Uncharacterized protein n=1 Tax=Brassicogethes aeneus TaxID=1431903 RepID=A0A9P0ATW9_BRAAE|nr:unnamed protein product [Brassicogethes aeneus]